MRVAGIFGYVNIRSRISGLFYDRDDPVTGLPLMVAGTPAAPPDLRIDIWKLIRAANDCRQ